MATLMILVFANFYFIFFSITAGIQYYFAALMIIKEHCQFYEHMLEPRSALEGMGWNSM